MEREGVLSSVKHNRPVIRKNQEVVDPTKKVLMKFERHDSVHPVFAKTQRNSDMNMDVSKPVTS